jgi:predicted DsbA family dithiol-disulfide isomerase
MNISQLSEKDTILEAVKSVGLNPVEIEECALKNETQELSREMVSQIKATGVYGTPTVFVNGEAVVGPKPYRVYRRLLN